MMVRSFVRRTSGDPSNQHVRTSRIGNLALQDPRRTSAERRNNRCSECQPEPSIRMKLNNSPLLFAALSTSYATPQYATAILIQ